MTPSPPPSTSQPVAPPVVENRVPRVIHRFAAQDYDATTHQIPSSVSNARLRLQQGQVKVRNDVGFEKALEMTLTAGVYEFDTRFPLSDLATTGATLVFIGNSVDLRATSYVFQTSVEEAMTPYAVTTRFGGRLTGTNDMGVFLHIIRADPRTNRTTLDCFSVERASGRPMQRTTIEGVFDPRMFQSAERITLGFPGAPETQSFTGLFFDVTLFDRPMSEDLFNKYVLERINNYQMEATRFLGCFRDTQTRAMTMITDIRGSWNDCRRRAEQNGYRYFALQDGNNGGGAQCFVSNSLPTAQQYGVVADSECNRPLDRETGRNLGGAWVNALYERLEVGILPEKRIRRPN